MCINYFWTNRRSSILFFLSFSFKYIFWEIYPTTQIDSLLVICGFCLMFRTLIMDLVKLWGFHSQFLRESKSLQVWWIYSRSFTKTLVAPFHLMEIFRNGLCRYFLRHSSELCEGFVFFQILQMVLSNGLISILSPSYLQPCTEPVVFLASVWLTSTRCIVF